MKPQLRNIFAFILDPLENGEGDFAYRESHRKILIMVSTLFLFLSTSVIIAGVLFQKWAATLPALIFFGAGLTCMIVGTLGSDRAVAKLWNRN